MAGFTFHIPYLIRMFTLLLYRWHTSGGFSYFDNFTVIRLLVFLWLQWFQHYRHWICYILLLFPYPYHLIIQLTQHYIFIWWVISKAYTHLNHYRLIRKLHYSNNLQFSYLNQFLVHFHHTHLMIGLIYLCHFYILFLKY